MKAILASAILASLGHDADAAGVGNFFSYFEGGGFGPSRWAFLDIPDNQCGGTQGASGYGQSPITIARSVVDACDTDMSAYDFQAGDCAWDQLEFTISNNGVKVAPAADTACSFGKMSIPHTPNKFNALQYHIHTYSEHEIEGMASRNGFFPAELHVVHQEETKESFAVFGTMIDVGPDAHPVFEYFLQGWEAASQKTQDSCPVRRLRSLAEVDLAGEENLFKPIQEVVTCPPIGITSFPTAPEYPAGEAPDIYDLPTNKDFGIFTYKGGLTTPACTEVVNWNLLDDAMLISATQMLRLQHLILCYVAQNKAEDGTLQSCSFATVADEAGSTSRPPQPLMGRKVSHRCRTGPSVEYVDVGEQPSTEPEFVKPQPRGEPSNTKSGLCDRDLYKDCSDDPRYNPNVSPNLKASNPAWNDAEGYWVGTMVAYDNTGAQMAESFASSKIRNTLPYPRDDIKVFLNTTVQETRFYEHMIKVYPPASAGFCSLPVPTEATNVIGEGKCGVHGYAAISEKFGTATHEKDGKVVVVFANGRFDGSTEGEVLPIDDRTFYEMVASDHFAISETKSFSNDALTQVTGSGQYLVFEDSGTYAKNPLAETTSFVLEQVSEADYKEMLVAAYDEMNVLDSDRIATDNDCAGDTCPTEEDYAQTDPLVVATPYKEDAQVKAGFIALFIILGLAVVIGVAYYLHLRGVKAQTDRYKQQFAKRIAETIGFTGHHEGLTAEMLQQEFKRIDIDGDGSLTKEEMRKFMGDKLDSRDFEAMFAAMDDDHNGTVEFAEFCAFLAHMTAAFDAAADIKRAASGDVHVANGKPAAVGVSQTVPADDIDGTVPANGVDAAVPAYGHSSQ